MSADEFGIIARHFAPLAGAAGLGLLDDAAVFAPPAGRALVVSADALVGGVHFLDDDPAELVARKLLRVNLSDLAAMGAVPLCYFVTVAVPADTPETWFAEFARGLAADQAQFGLWLGGGDTSSTPGPVSLSATVIGHVAPGAALRRAGSGAGDELWVTGTIGAGALGLLARRGAIADPDGTLTARYVLPEPRLGLALAGIVSAAMDVSDGLVQDAGHLARLAGLRAVIEAAEVPVPAVARGDGEMLARCLTGGDDYELLLAVPPARAPALRAEAARAGIPVTRIGLFAAGAPGVAVRGADGREMALARPGWRHF